MDGFRQAWSLPVTWQRWRSHHSIRHSRKPHATRKLHGSMFYRTAVINNRIWEQWFFYLSAPVTLTLTRWPSCTNLSLMPGDIPDVQIWTLYVKAFESYRLTDRQTDRHDRNYTPRRFAGWSTNFVVRKEVCCIRFSSRCTIACTLAHLENLIKRKYVFSSTEPIACSDDIPSMTIAMPAAWVVVVVGMVMGL